MTTRYTNAEWKAIIAHTERGLVISRQPHLCPDLASGAFNKAIDHTLLKPEVKPVQFDDLCDEARANGFAQCVAHLRGSDVKVASVIGFHEGTYKLSHKLQEVEQSLSDGATELDVVINYPLLKAGKYEAVYDELAALRERAPQPTLLKLILETSQLDAPAIVAGCVLADAAEFDFVKTSTGFNGPGATVDSVRLMSACCVTLAVGRPDARRMRVKASGGIRSLAHAVAMIEAGASRLGTSAGVGIAKEAREPGRRSGTAAASSSAAADLRAPRPKLATTDY